MSRQRRDRQRAYLAQSYVAQILTKATNLPKGFL
jgi:hypothetical protein